MQKLLSNDLNSHLARLEAEIIHEYLSLNALNKRLAVMNPTTDYQISEEAHALVHDLSNLSIDIQRVAGRLDNSRHMLRALANEAAILTNHLGDHL